jgi:prepilin-type N-terminal cleavage/methylation domain-containing protein
MPKGYTLIELLIAMTIMVILSAIAVPLYNGYIDSSRTGVLINNIASIEIFQEDFRLRTGGYAVNLADVDAITAAIGWEPRADDGITYSIANGDGTTYDITATDVENHVVCMSFPDKDRC